MGLVVIAAQAAGNDMAVAIVALEATLAVLGTTLAGATPPDRDAEASIYASLQCNVVNSIGGGTPDPNASSGLWTIPAWSPRMGRILQSWDQAQEEIHG